MPRARTTVRRAICTRKSTEEGLEQEFNTLHAQRESAEAYIASQRAEGWVCLPEQYDPVIAFAIALSNLNVRPLCSKPAPSRGASRRDRPLPADRPAGSVRPA